MTISIFIFFVPFGVANGKLKEIKKEKGWGKPENTDIEVEMKSAGRIRCVRWFHLFPQCVTSVILTVITGLRDLEGGKQALFIAMITFSVTVFLFWGLAVWMDRQKTQIISSDSDVNVNYSRAKKNLYKNFWVLCAWVTVFYMAWMMFCVDKSGAFTSMFWWATGVYMAATVGVLVRLIKKKTALDKLYEGKRNKMTCEDDDENWIWGMIYYNPRDRHSAVEKRVGIGTSINMATPVGKGFAAFFGLTMLSLPVISIWIILLEFTPIQLTVNENQIVATHIRNEYVISMPAVEKAELLSELPKMSRNSGTAMENLKKGSWSVTEEGNCTVFLDPRNEVFLRIETSAGRYYLSGYDDTETRMVYEAVKMWQEQRNVK